MKRTISILAAAFASIQLLQAQQSLVPDSTFVTGAEPAKQELINDYSMIGVNYGVTFSNMYYSPSRHNRAYVFSPNYISIMYTKYSKMFGYIPNFGFSIGVATGNEGFAFKPNPQSGYVDNVDGAQRASIRVIEVPMLAQGHVDFDPLKLMISAGIYGGWRLGIQRSGPELDPQWQNAFRDYENRFDYGLQGGAGIAFMLDPVEIHFNCNIRWSWSSIYQPDYHDKYYFNYAYPLDIYATVGVHFQITKRRGKTRRELRRQAYEQVYGKDQDSTGQDRQDTEHRL